MLLSRRLIISIVILSICVACGNIKNKQVTEKNKSKLWEELRDSRGLTVEEVQLLQSYMIRHGIKDVLAGKDVEMPVGKSVGEMISEQRRYVNDQKFKEAEDNRRREEARAAEQEQRKVLLDALSVTIYEKGFQTYEYQDYITIKLSYENHSARDIRGFKGMVVWRDLFGDEVRKNSLKEDQILKAGETRRVSRTLAYNKFDSGDQLLLSKSLDNLKVEWLPAMIVFTDGSKLQAGDEQ